MTLTIGWAIFATFGIVFWFWPFLASYYTYRPFYRYAVMRTRWGGSAYGAVWHVLAHTLFVYSLGSDPRSVAVLVPLGIGALWGSWLPTAYAPPVTDTGPCDR